MSLRATLWALDDAPVENGTEVLCLIALADEAGDDGRNAFPSIRKVAARARVKRRAAQYALRKLEESGVIVKGDQAAAARHISRIDRRPTVYDLNTSMTWESVGKVRPGTEAEDGVQNVHPVERGANSRPGGVQTHVERGANSRPDGVHVDAPDPSTNPVTTDPTKDPAAADSVAAQADALSRAWWDFYQAEYGQVIRSGKSNPFMALRDNIVKPALEADYTEYEIKCALRGPTDRQPDAVPAKSVFQRRLGEVRKPTSRTGSNVHRLPTDDATRQGHVAAFERSHHG